MSNDKPHGNYLRAWRKHRGLTQEALAEAVDYDRTVISKIERGAIQYTQGFLEKAAKVLDCEPGQLISTDPEDERKVMDIWDRILEREQPRALDILKTFAEKK